MTWNRPSPVAWVFVVSNVALAALLLLAVFSGLAVRWWVVDGAAVIVAVALLVASAALAANAPWRRLAVRVGAGIVLGVGLLSIGALVIGAAYVRGVTGPVGTKGVLYFMLSVALLLPYLVGYPALQLYWVRGQRGQVEQT